MANTRDSLPVFSAMIRGLYEVKPWFLTYPGMAFLLLTDAYTA
jgi:hypothetical protein